MTFIENKKAFNDKESNLKDKILRVHLMDRVPNFLENQKS